MDGELKRFVVMEIRRHMNVLMYGDSIDATGKRESIGNLFEGMATIENRPVVQPFGLTSRAPKGTTQMTARVGDHFASRVVIGHLDKGRPTPEDEGATILYDAFGHEIHLTSDGMLLGSGEADEPLVLGDELKTLLSTLLQGLIAMAGALVPAQPGAVAALTLIKTQVDLGVFNSNTVFTEKGSLL